MFALQLHPVPASISVRLIGVLDADLVAAFAALERGLAESSGATVIVDVRDLGPLGETDMHGLAGAIGVARAAGRDVRLDVRSPAWRRVAKRELAGQPPIDPVLRAGVRRTVILAHSAKRKHD